MESGRIQIGGWRWVAGIAVLYAVAGIISLEAAMRSDGIAFVWPASGIAVGGLLLTARNYRMPVLGGIFVASFVANFYAGSPWSTALFFSFANIVEAVIVGRIACTDRRDCARLDRPHWVARFCIGALAGSMASATLATLWTSGQGHPAAFFLSWSTTVLLGLMVVGPLVLAVAHRYISPDAHMLNRSSLAWTGLFGAALLLSLMVFGQDSMPLLYLPVAMAVLLTFLFGPVGAAGMVFIVAVVGSIFTARGGGPINLVEGGGQLKALYFQLYLMVMLASTLPMATLLAQSRRSARELQRSNALLSAAEAKAHVGHWTLDLETQSLFWSDEVYAIHDVPSDEVPDVEMALAAYHPDDRERVKNMLQQAIERQEAFSFEARIVRPDGTIRYVESNGEAEIENGDVVAMFGVILDITERWQIQEELRRARNQARKQARDATKLADTDQLTGIASRRKFMERLNTEIARAEREDTPLSLIMFDIDHFKAFNDTHGHAFGDLVLKLVAREAADCTRGKDLIGRIGGEEFAIVMPGAHMGVGAQVAERIRSRIADLSVEDEAGVQQAVSISLGIGSWKPGADEVWLMQAADNALYEAKRAGRNCLREAA